MNYYQSTATASTSVTDSTTDTNAGTGSPERHFSWWYWINTYYEALVPVPVVKNPYVLPKPPMELDCGMLRFDLMGLRDKIIVCRNRQRAYTCKNFKRMN